MSLPSNDFSFIIPADLEKGADGEWRIRGLASTEKTDQQGEIILQKGIDVTPIDRRKGLINFDHAKGPENCIGLLDGYQKTAQGLVVEGRLFKNHTKAKAVYEIMSSLSKGDRGRVGLSVEGKILRRNAANPSIIEKCQINAVAVTLNPVNQDTFADLVKSMAESEVDFESTDNLNEVPESNTTEPTFSTAQVLAIMHKALGAGAPGLKAPADRSGGEALALESLDSDKKKKKAKDEAEVEKGGPGSGPKPSGQVAGPAESHSANLDKLEAETGHIIMTPARMARKRKLRAMTKTMYKSNLIGVLDKLQVLYPDYSRSELWEAVKERLDTKFDGLGESK